MLCNAMIGLFSRCGNVRSIYYRVLSNTSTSTLPCPNRKERVVILGSGWAGFRLAKDLDKDKYDICVLSPRNHFLFTPLLPSTTVGTLEFRCIKEPVRTIRGISYHQCKAEDIDFDKKLVHCRDIHMQHQKEFAQFKLPYDKLVIAVGCKAATFGIPGVANHEEINFAAEKKVVKSETGTGHHNVMFLKQIKHARAIRNRILECFERASNPHVNEAERNRLLTFAVVGGGPTSVEFTSELNDFLREDVSIWYPDLSNNVRVVLIERGKHLLAGFDSSLQTYVKNKFATKNVEVLTEVSVKEVHVESLLMESIGEDGVSCVSELPFGVCVWSIGNQPLDFVKNLNLDSFETGPNQGRIKIDDQLKILDTSVPSHEDIYALGDCAAHHIDPLGRLAQVANQQAVYLAKHLNGATESTFQYHFFGSMASLGAFDAVFEGAKGGRLKGLTAYLTWRSAYWVKSVSVANKFLIPMFWFKSFWFGRDISKF